MSYSSHENFNDGAIRRLLALVALGIAIYLFWLLFPPSVNTVNGSSAATERVRLTTNFKNNTYYVTIEYTVHKKRMLLAQVIDVKNVPHRIIRTLANPGTRTMEWKAHKSKFGRLYKACAAMHNTRGKRETTSYDCANF